MQTHRTPVLQCIPMNGDDPAVLRRHNCTLRGERARLRPMTEADWPVISVWETDPEVVYWADTDAGSSTRTIEEMKHIFRTVSQKALCFVIELDGHPIGDCWLQHMNLDEVLRRYPGMDCRRIDLALRKERWGQGLGTDVIRTLLRFAFEQERADIVFGLVGDYNPRSARAAGKAAMQQVFEMADPPGSRAQSTLAHAITRDEWQKTQA